MATTSCSTPPPPPCSVCGTIRRRRTRTGTPEFPVWICGTCQHRQARRINTREMYGRGRRGY